LLAATLDSIADRLERSAVLDKPSDLLAGLVRRLLPEGPVADAASGTPIGHPLHPLVVAVPIGSWVAASYLDLTAGDAKAAQRLVGLGNLAALPAALTGANDWLSTSGGERRVGLSHAVLNFTALSLYTGSWLARRNGRRVKGAALAMVGAGVLTGSGWLGGHLSYALGVGVDTTAFEQLPTEWTDACGEAEVPAEVPTRFDVDGVPVLLVRHEGRLLALADRCTHRGGPLHEGEIRDGCVTCPWHHSSFRLSDGSVASGPATRPEPVLEVRVVDGRVQVRRAEEPRSLRTNPVGT
jgi:nitrite reductase/ring-hydroxylating ferredoxin subunit/uncharacterized membrane protein